MLQLHSNGTLLSLSRLFSLRGRFLHSFSTSSSTTSEKASSSLVDYLVNSLSFSKEEAIATSLKVINPNSKRNPISVVDFLKQNGFDDTHIKILVSRDPNVLRSDVEKTLKPKFRVLQDLGLSGSDLGDFIANKGSLTIMKLSTETMLAAVDFLTPIMGTHENVLKVLKKSHWGFSIDNATRNVAVLRNYGVSSERIQKVFVRYSQILKYSPQKLDEICARVEEELGLSVEMPAFLPMVRVLISSKAENVDLKYHVFRSYGWSDSDIGSLARRVPECVTRSEVAIRCKLEFLMKKIGFEAGYIASRPSLLTLSLEKRVVPRNAVLQVLKERKLISASFSLYRAVKMSESLFLNKVVIPYKDELPGLFEAYTNNKMDSFSKS